MNSQEDEKIRETITLNTKILLREYETENEKLIANNQFMIMQLFRNLEQRIEKLERGKNEI